MNQLKQTIKYILSNEQGFLGINGSTPFFGGIADAGSFIGNTLNGSNNQPIPSFSGGSVGSNAIIQGSPTITYGGGGSTTNNNNTVTRQTAGAPAPTAPSQNNSPIGQISQPDISAQLDALYNPQIDSLNQQADYLNNSALPAAQSTINTNAANLQGQLNTNIAGVRTATATQQDQIAHQKESALSQAGTAYAAMLQRIQNRFGSNSAAMGMTGLENQAYQQEQGGILNNYNTNATQLSNQLLAGENWYAQQKQGIQNSTADKLQQVQNLFQQQLGQIAQDKNMLASERAQANLTALQHTIDLSQQVQAFAQQQQVSLDTWKQQETQLVSSGYQNLQNSFQPMQNYSAPQLPQIGSSAQFNQGVVYNPQQQGTDQFGNLLNPLVPQQQQQQQAPF